MTFSGIVQFKDNHSRDLQPTFLAQGVQWYGWLGPHLRTHMIFFGIVQFKDTHCWGSENIFSGPRFGVLRVVGAPPQNPPDIFCHCVVPRHSF